MASAETRVLLVGGALVDIYVDAFIPGVRVDNPVFGWDSPTGYYAFKGDNRTGSNGNALFMKGGSARMWSSVVVELDAAEPLLHNEHDTQESVGYFIKPVFSNGGLHFVEASDTAKASPDNMRESASRVGRPIKGVPPDFLPADFLTVFIYGKSANPLVAFAPPILYNFAITLSAKQNLITYEIHGVHDYFPSFEIYIGSNRVYEYDSKGHTPWQLAKPSDILPVGKDVDIGPTEISQSSAFDSPVWKQGGGRRLCFKHDPWFTTF
jgi:hypothetical protein